MGHFVPAALAGRSLSRAPSLSRPLCLALQHLTVGSPTCRRAISAMIYPQCFPNYHFYIFNPLDL